MVVILEELNPNQVIWDIFNGLKTNEELEAIDWINVRIGSEKGETLFFNGANWGVVSISFAPHDKRYPHLQSREDFTNRAEKGVILSLKPRNPTGTPILFLNIHITKGKTECDIYSMAGEKYAISGKEFSNPDFFILNFIYDKYSAIRVWLRSEYMPKTIGQLPNIFSVIKRRKSHDYQEW